MRYYFRINAVPRRRTADHIADLVAPCGAVTHLDAAHETLVPGMNISTNEPTRRH
jgi:hypothetical protein